MAPQQLFPGLLRAHSKHKIASLLISMQKGQKGTWAESIFMGKKLVWNEVRRNSDCCFIFSGWSRCGVRYICKSQATLNSFLREIKSWEIWISLMQHIFHMWTTTHVHHLTPATWFIQGSLCCKSKSNQARMRHVNYESLIAFNVWENLGFLRSILCNAVFN